MDEYKKRLYMLDYKIKERHKLFNEIESNNNADRIIANEIFKKPFKIRGTHAKVEKYSMIFNEIILIPTYSNKGVDRLVLTFEEFANQVEFI